MKKLFRVYTRQNSNDLKTNYCLADCFADAAQLFEAQSIVLIELMGWTEGNDKIFVDA